MARKLRNRRRPRKPKPPPFDLERALGEPPPSDSKFDLEKTLGEVVIKWNYLENSYHHFVNVYMAGLSVDVAALVLNAMNSTSKAALFEFLTTKYETHEGFLAHLSHFQKMMHVLTENRNVLQHSLPSVEPSFGYWGIIYKRNKLGKPVRYKASEDDLVQIIFDLDDARGYVEQLIALKTAQLRAQRKRSKYKHFDAWVKAIEKPDLPRKLIPSPLGPMPEAG